MDKKGQFYIIATLVLISLIVGLMSLSNYASKETYSGINHLRDEIIIEGKRVLEYTTDPENNLNDEEVNEVFEEFVSGYENRGEIHFIVGNNKNITEYSYSDLDVTFYVKDEGSWNEFWDSYSGNDISKVKIKVSEDDLEREYDFEIRKGENFYFLVSSEIEEERYIATNQF